MSTWASYLPEFMQQYTIWGGAGYLLQTFHMDGTIPYWACFSLINILVRTMLFPLTLYSAHTAARFRPVAPELQFVVQLYETNFRVARQQMRQHFRYIFREGLETVRGIYKLHKVNPLAPFLSPLLQIPVFVYISTDLRKIVNGRDPELAQALTDCGGESSLLFWVRDLTEADPYFILPVLAGTAMYANVEVALGKQSLAGEASSKANSAIFMKDLFQSVAVFMPCFCAHFPAGMQVYLCTTFLFTAGQSFALRNDPFRQLFGLPPLNNAPPVEAKYAQQLLALKQAERQADELRGDGPVLGMGVLVRGLRVSFAGTPRPTTIQVDRQAPRALQLEGDPVFDIIQECNFKVNPQQQQQQQQANFIPGISAPHEEMMERVQEDELVKRLQQHLEYNSEGGGGDKQLTEDEMIELMEKANRGERPVVMGANKDDKKKEETPPKLQKTLNKKRGGKKKKGAGRAKKRSNKR